MSTPSPCLPTIHIYNVCDLLFERIHLKIVVVSVR